MPKESRRSSRRSKKRAPKCRSRRSRRTHTRSYRASSQKESLQQRLQQQPFNIYKGDTVKLANRHLEEKHLNIFADACEHNILYECRFLDLSGNQISTNGIKNLAGKIKALPILETLKLSNNNIQDAGCSALAEAIDMGAMVNVAELNLGMNQISDDGVAALARAITPDNQGGMALAHCNTLTLTLNRIGDRGVEALCSALGRGALPVLKKLNISLNPVGLEGSRKAQNVILDRTPP